MVSSKEIVFTLIPVLLWYIGGMIAYFKPPGAALKSIILHFAAGVVFSVVAVELLPDMIKIHDAKSIIIGFSSGVAAMLLIKYFTGKIQPAVKVGEVNGLPWGVLIAMGIDLLIDGILLGIGFAAGEKEGVLLAVALALECLSLGIATVTSLSGGGIKKCGGLPLLSLFPIQGHATAFQAPDISNPRGPEGMAVSRQEPWHSILLRQVKQTNKQTSWQLRETKPL